MIGILGRRAAEADVGGPPRCHHGGRSSPLGRRFFSERDRVVVDHAVAERAAYLSRWVEYGLPLRFMLLETILSIITLSGESSDPVQQMFAFDVLLSANLGKML
jgi:hypothetical protein